jgi:hypothetical protein
VAPPVVMEQGAFSARNPPSRVGPTSPPAVCQRP